jgi:hypothetical protein
MEINLDKWEDMGAQLENLELLNKLLNKLMELYRKEDIYNRDNRLSLAIGRVENHIDRNTPRDYGKISKDLWAHMKKNKI